MAAEHEEQDDLDDFLAAAAAGQEPTGAGEEAPGGAYEPEDLLTLEDAVRGPQEHQEVDAFLDALTDRCRGLVAEHLRRRRNPFDVGQAPDPARVAALLDNVRTRLRPVLLRRLGETWCGIKLSPKVLQAAVKRMIAQRGTLVPDISSNRDDWVAQSSADLLGFLRQYSSFSGSQENCRYFIQNVWDGITGGAAVAMRASRSRSAQLTEAIHDIREMMSRSQTRPRSPDAVPPGPQQVAKQPPAKVPMKAPIFIPVGNLPQKHKAEAKAPAKAPGKAPSKTHQP